MCVHASCVQILHEWGRGVLQEVISKMFSRRVKGRLPRGDGRLSKEGVISWRGEQSFSMGGEIFQK